MNSVITKAAWFLAGVVVAVSISSFSQPYVGINLGAGNSVNTDTDCGGTCGGREYAPGAYANGEDYALQISMGDRFGMFAGEIGWLRLPSYKAHNVGLNPPREASQEITASAPYLRGLIYGPKFFGAEPFGFVGVARVHGKNHEIGSCPTCGEGYVPDWHSETTTNRPYYGFGIESKVGALNLRAEVGRIPAAMDSLWTGRRDYTIATFGLRFSL